MGKFIIVEGPDFCGKSTQIDLIDTNGYYMDNNIFFTREPGSFLPNSIEKCESIRNKILYEDHTPLEEALLFSESRYFHTRDIVALMNKYKDVSIISDRYIVSSLAYQGYAQGLGKEIIYLINKFNLELLKKNNIQIHCIKFNISEEEWLKRRAKRENIECFDSIERKDIHGKVLDFYMNNEIFDEYTKDLDMIVYPINANASTEDIQKEFKITMDNLIYGLN